MEKGTPLFFVLIDNLRFDQWKTIQPIFAESFRIHEEETFIRYYLLLHSMPEMQFLPGCCR